MGDDTKRLSPGELWRPTADTLNGYQEAADFIRNLKAGGGALPAGLETGPPVTVKNASGSDQGRFAVLGIDAPIITPADNVDVFQQKVGLKGIMPTVADHRDRWLVALRPLAQNALGPAVASGVVPVRVYVRGIYHPFCDVIAKETVDGEDCCLGTGESGARILWRENAGSGVGTIVWAVVRLGTVGSETLIGKLDNALSQGGSATVSVWTWSGSSFTDTGLDVTAYDWLMKVGSTTIAAGKKVVCQLISGIYIVTEAECA